MLKVALLRLTFSTLDVAANRPQVFSNSLHSSPSALRLAFAGFHFITTITGYVPNGTLIPIYCTTWALVKISATLGIGCRLGHNQTHECLDSTVVPPKSTSA